MVDIRKLVFKVKVLVLKAFLSLCWLMLYALSKTPGRPVLELTRHKTWLYRYGTSVFSQKHFVGDIPPVTDEDRLIAADVSRHFESMRELGASAAPVSVWDPERMGAADFMKVLESGNIEAIAKSLTSMFHSRYIQGMSHSYRHKAEPISSTLVPVLIEDRLLTLAEYLGIAPAETAEQGVPALAVKDGLEPIVAGVEKALGYSMAFPGNHGASGIEVGGRLLTLRQMQHIHMSVCMQHALKIFNDKPQPKNIVEIGGGFGGLCYWSLKTLGNDLATYTIIDLPWVNAIQAAFLKKALGRDRVAFWTDTPEEIAKARIFLCSAYHYHDIPQLAKIHDLYVNQDSFPEMPASVLSDYIAFLKTKSGALLFSHNHENGTAVNGVPQNNPSRVIQNEMGGQRLSRALSTMREGYADEIYRML